MTKLSRKTVTIIAVALDRNGPEIRDSFFRHSLNGTKIPLEHYVLAIGQVETKILVWRGSPRAEDYELALTELKEKQSRVADYKQTKQ